jgi:hypothetical protein
VTNCFHRLVGTVRPPKRTLLVIDLHRVLSYVPARIELQHQPYLPIKYYLDVCKNNERYRASPKENTTTTRRTSTISAASLAASVLHVANTIHHPPHAHTLPNLLLLNTPQLKSSPLNQNPKKRRRKKSEAPTKKRKLWKRKK